MIKKLGRRATGRVLATLLGAGFLVAGLAGVHATQALAYGAGMACVFNAPHGGGDFGHIGWGYELGSSGTFVYGSTEDPNGDMGINTDGHGGFVDYVTGAHTALGAWSRQGNFLQMLGDFHVQTAQWGWPYAPPHAINDYTRYKCVNVTNSNVTQANNAVNQVEHIGEPGPGTTGVMYRLTGWNCMNMADYILTQYNAQGLPNPGLYWAPNNWFAAINATPLALPSVGYQVTGTDSQGLAIQWHPQVNNVRGWAHNGTTLTIVCQTKRGDQVDGKTQYGRPFTTWDMLWDGNYVYDWYMNTPTVATTGYSPGIHPCVNG